MYAIKIKAEQAADSVITLITRSKFICWQSKIQLYSFSLGSNILERVRINFFKRLLLLPQSTPDCIISTETGRTSFLYTIFEYTLNCLIKLLDMDNPIFPKLCFLRVLHLFSRCRNCDAIYNWVNPFIINE